MKNIFFLNSKPKEIYSLERVVPENAKQHNLLIEHLARYQFAKSYISGKRVLDAGCGNGYGTKLLSESGVKEIIGIDISQEAIEYSKKHYFGKNISFIKMDCQLLNFPENSFDTVVAFESIEHLKHPELFLRKVSHILTKSGYLIVSTPNNPNNTPVTNKYHYHEYNSRNYKILLSKYFKHVRLYGQAYSNKSKQRIKKTAQKISRMPDWLNKAIPKQLKNFIFENFLNNSIYKLNTDDIMIKPGILQHAIYLVAVCHK